VEAFGTLKAALYERSAGAEESRGIGGLMASTRLKDILGAIFRSNPAYELVEFARLSPALQAALLGPLEDEDCFGVLRPAVESGLELKAVGKDTALLFYALSVPGRLPAFVTRAASEEVNALIAELVVDEVLQIAVEGGFASGAAARDLVHERCEPVESQTKRAAANRFSQGERLLADYVRRLDPAGVLFEAGLPDPPHASINYGSGGVAYFLYRLACIREDAQLLSWAKLWIEKALQDCETKGEFAFSDADGQPPQEIIGPVALYHSPTGLHAVKALIGHAADDCACQMDGLAGFVKAAQSPCENIDVTLGISGVLLGAALLDEAMPGQPDVRSLGARLLGDIWGQLDAMPRLAEGKRLRCTGIAHGWAGVLYAVLGWCRTADSPLPANLAQRLDQLADLAECWGDGVRWGQQIRSVVDRDHTDFPASWCNGTAGMIHLWTRAHEMLDDTRFLKLAEGAARNVIAEPEPFAQLCCGQPGQAYALLNLYKHTGERHWLNHAHKFAQQSCHLSPAPADTQAPPLHYALYKGPLGTALLSADLEVPSEACMPMFESEGWKATMPQTWRR
jgi:eukaryotic-like serine/threonine-protein kinase